MRVGMFLNYAGGFREVADEVAELERAGVDLIAVPEAYSFDAVSELGFLAARTSTISSPPASCSSTRARPPSPR